MQIKKILIIYSLLLSIHPYSFSGELITIAGLDACNPVISLQLKRSELKLLTDGTKKENDFLALYMVVNDTAAAHPVAGNYKVDNGRLKFTPLYTLGYDLEFEVHYTSGKHQGVERFITPEHPLSHITPEVLSIYPHADTIPYNTLFFNVRFTHSMLKDDKAYEYIKVYNENGDERENAWRQRSFWMDDEKLLVLMVHPGKVKQGISYESPLFDSGKWYTLHIGKDIKDINDNSITETYTKRFYIKGEDRESPELLKSELKIPDPFTLNPLQLSFSEGVDYASVFDGIMVYDSTGDLIKCRLTEVGNCDSVYMLTPVRPWAKGKYKMVLKSTVCDFAANRFNRLFEITDIKEIEKDNINTILEFELN